MLVHLAALICHYFTTAYSAGAQVPRVEEPVRLSVDADGSVLREEPQPRTSDVSKVTSHSVQLDEPAVASPVRFSAAVQVSKNAEVSPHFPGDKELKEHFPGEKGLKKITQQNNRNYRKQKRYQHPGEKKLKDTWQPTLAGKAPIAGAPISDVPMQDAHGRFVWGLVLGAIAVATFGAVFMMRIPNGNEIKESDDPASLLQGTSTFLAACVLGMINNNAYNTIMGASQQLAAIYDREDDIALFPCIMLFACLGLTVMNGAYFLTFSFKNRIMTMCGVLCSSYVVLAWSTTRGGDFNFVLSLVAAMGIGATTSLGELCCLSFLRSFPPEALGGWGAGTGLAGIFGSSVYLSLESSGFTPAEIFLLMAPTVFVYWWAFQYLNSKVEAARQLSVARGNTCFPPPEEPGAPLTYGTLKTVCSTSSGILFCMVAVYFLEYFIYPGLVDRDTLCPQGKSWLTKNAFTVSWIAYNVGVTCSRASVTFFRIERLSILVILQLINACLWIYEAMTHQLITWFGEGGYYVLILWMVWVGVMGGCTYVNCMHAFGKREDIPDELRELGITVGFAMSNIGIVVATGLGGILDNSILSFQHLFPDGCPQ